jgi:hypothetical protein
MTTTAPATERRQILHRRSLRLAYATAPYNVLEGLVATSGRAQPGSARPQSARRTTWALSEEVQS